MGSYPSLLRTIKLKEGTRLGTLALASLIVLLLLLIARFFIGVPQAGGRSVPETTKPVPVIEATITAAECDNKCQEALKPAPKPVQRVTGTKFEWLTAAGIPQSVWTYVDYIVTKESGWNYLVWNKQGSGAYGLCQSLPASKMASAGPDYMNNPVTQLRWCHSYAQSRYGGWYNAYIFWTRVGWW